jgi:hypothetical protein
VSQKGLPYQNYPGKPFIGFGEKNYSTEQTEILIHSVGIPPGFLNGKCSEFRTKPFFGHSEPCNFVLNQSVEDKNALINSVPNHFGHSELRNFVLNHSAEDKNAPYSVPIHFVRRKTLGNFVILF